MSEENPDSKTEGEVKFHLGMVHTWPVLLKRLFGSSAAAEREARAEDFRKKSNEPYRPAQSAGQKGAERPSARERSKATAESTEQIQRARQEQNRVEAAAPATGDPGAPRVVKGDQVSDLERRERQLKERELKQRAREVSKKEREEQAKQWTGIGCGGLIILVILIVAIASIGGSGEDGPDNEVTSAVKKACGSEISCVVKVDVGSVLGIDVDRELLIAQEDYWVEIAKQPKLVSAKVTLIGETVDQFGNPGRGEILNVACDRRAFTRLNWGSSLLEPSQVKAQCDWYGIADE